MNRKAQGSAPGWGNAPAVTAALVAAFFVSGCTATTQQFYAQQVQPRLDAAGEHVQDAYRDRKPTPKTGEWPHSEFGD